MKVARRLAAGLAVGVVLIAVVEIGSSRYLEQRRQTYQRNVAELERRTSSYRRPTSGGNPLDENAAVWYRLAMSRMMDVSPALLVPILKGGPEHYRELVNDRILHACREVRAPRVDAAMRSSRCDWDIGSASDPRDGFEYEREALALGYCLGIDGHRASADRKMDDALNAYLRALSFGCDLGNGDGTMTMIGLSTALAALSGIERLVMHTDDSQFLTAASSRLEPYSSCLPTAERPLTSERLWLENATALGKLQYEGHPVNWDAADDWRAAWRLWLVTPITRSLAALSSIDDFDQAMKAAGEIGAQSKRSSNPIVKTMDVAHEALLRPSAIQLTSHLRLTQLAIGLQRWHAGRHEYPPDVVSLGLSSNLASLHYVRTRDGQGYTLTGVVGTEVERQPGE